MGTAAAIRTLNDFKRTFTILRIFSWQTSTSYTDWLSSGTVSLSSCIENAYHSSERCTGPPDVLERASQIV